jgi:hypothetical protein
VSTFTLTLDIPAALWHTSNDRGAWYMFASRKKEIRALAKTVAKAADIGTFQIAHVTAHIGYPRNGTADPGNASPVVKAMLDGLTDAGVWADDDSSHVIGPDYRREVGVTGKAGIHTVRLVLVEQEATF